MNRSAVLGWSCPWSGDEVEPIPASYWLWYRLYRWTRQAKHRIRWHDWREIGWHNPPGPEYVSLHEHCDWCGATRPAAIN